MVIICFFHQTLERSRSPLARKDGMDKACIQLYIHVGCVFDCMALVHVYYLNPCDIHHSIGSTPGCSLHVTDHDPLLHKPDV